MVDRIQLKRTAGWKMPPNTVKVSRPTPFGNPFRIGMLGVPDATTAVERFRAMCEQANLNDTRHFMFRRDSIDHYLRGKNLACWCPIGTPCHADVLLKIANANPPERGPS
ncbi:MAG: DUF4326 domain-containing protein [Betaproteobacteria bacterium]